MKQKLIVYTIAIAICAVGFPFYWEFTHGPDSTVDKMFNGMALTGAVGYCADASVKDKVQMGLGLTIMQSGMTKECLPIKSIIQKHPISIDFHTAICYTMCK